MLKQRELYCIHVRRWGETGWKLDDLVELVEYACIAFPGKHTFCVLHLTPGAHHAWHIHHGTMFP